MPARAWGFKSPLRHFADQGECPGEDAGIIGEPVTVEPTLNSGSKWSSAQPYGVVMHLLLISGQPGAGKSTYCQWLSEKHGYVHVETDAEWRAWGPLLTDPEFRSAVEIRNRLRQLGPNVAFEWGFLGPTRSTWDVDLGFSWSDECAT